jgi:hypothetical protein
MQSDYTDEWTQLLFGSLYEQGNLIVRNGKHYIEYDNEPFRTGKSRRSMKLRVSKKYLNAIDPKIVQLRLYKLIRVKQTRLGITIDRSLVRKLARRLGRKHWNTFINGLTFDQHIILRSLVKNGYHP